MSADALVWRRFWSKVAVGDQCWDWQAARTSAGYGVFQLDGKAQRSHRVAWRLWHGKALPAEASVLHHCDRPICVRPDHIYAGTASDNMRDRSRRGRHPTRAILASRRSYVGASNPRAKLTSTQVAEIRELSTRGVHQRVLAKDYGISKGQVWHIVSCRQWPGDDLEQTDNRPREEDGEQDIDQEPIAPPGSPG